MNNNLKKINASIYSKLSLQITDFTPEAESKEYYASQFSLGNLKIIDRTSKITPKKIGQFVTFWKRDGDDPITPFHESDILDFYTVSCANGNQLGQFIFPKSILIKKGILATVTKKGKLAFRVYPSWDTPTSKQAIQTQKWQLNFFYIVGEIGAQKAAAKLLIQK